MDIRMDDSGSRGGHCVHCSDGRGCERGLNGTCGRFSRVARPAEETGGGAQARRGGERYGTAALLHECDRFLGHRLRGLRGAAKVLEILAGEEELSQRELQDRLGVQPGSLSEMLARLEEHGFVERRRDEFDRRAMRVALTGLGRREAQWNREAGEEDPFDVLTEEENGALRALLQKLLDAWTERCGGRHAHGERRRGAGERRHPHGHGGHRGREMGAAR